MIDIEQHGDVRVMHWNDGENRFSAPSIARWHAVLDELESIEGPLALVVRGEGKFFSNGLDLDGFAADPESAGAVVDDVHRLLGRMLLFPAYTVAALNGHAFAAGAMLSCTFDRRVMRADRGYWCLPEADLGLPLTEGMHAAVAARLPRLATADAMLTARRYTAADALAIGIVDEVADEDAVLSAAIAAAAPMATKDRKVVAEHKRLLFGDAAAVCGWPPAS